MPNYTTNYKLIKPLPTELYDIEVFNDNMEKVDKGLVDLKNSTYSKEEVNNLLKTGDITITVDDVVTADGTNPVSGKAVAVYVSEQLAAILNFEEVAF